MDRFIILFFVQILMFPLPADAMFHAAVAAGAVAAGDICTDIGIGITGNFIYDSIKERFHLFSKDEKNSFSSHLDNFTSLAEKEKNAGCLSREDIQMITNEVTEIKQILQRIDERLNGNDEAVRNILSELYKISNKLNDHPSIALPSSSDRIVNILPDPNRRKKRISAAKKAKQYDELSDFPELPVQHYLQPPTFLPHPPPFPPPNPHALPPPPPQHIIPPPNMLPPPFPPPNILHPSSPPPPMPFPPPPIR